MECLIHLLQASRHLELIADHATNIAEDIICMINGEIVRHHAEDYKQQTKKYWHTYGLRARSQR